ncbi:MAG: prepilin-type N-terminal cleavage/methylation domain-containing protein, partial [Candidatus Eremiobacteraeota bacterium]|nr:prepilin-type N-terminal cleavage/methylation domain-containing protein [Candidatus Eremiobacteraeota bacterium]
MRGRGGEQGFTLIEVAIAAAIWTFLGGAFLLLTQNAFASAAQLAESRRAYLQLTRLV